MACDLVIAFVLLLVSCDVVIASVCRCVLMLSLFELALKCSDVSFVSYCWCFVNEFCVLFCVF